MKHEVAVLASAGCTKVPVQDEQTAARNSFPALVSVVLCSGSLGISVTTFAASFIDIPAASSPRRTCVTIRISSKKLLITASKWQAEVDQSSTLSKQLWDFCHVPFYGRSCSHRCSHMKGDRRGFLALFRDLHRAALRLQFGLGFKGPMEEGFRDCFAAGELKYSPFSFFQLGRSENTHSPDWQSLLSTNEYQ